MRDDILTKKFHLKICYDDADIADVVFLGLNKLLYDSSSFVEQFDHILDMKSGSVASEPFLDGEGSLFSLFC